MSKFDYFKVHKLSQRAENPYREHKNDIGWDVTLIARTDNRVEDETGHVNMFKTGLQLEPPQGFYFEMMARSSLHKAGYMLATGTSIIDPGYRGELLVPLYKFRDGDDIELPMRAVQLVVKKAEKVLPYIVNAPLDGSSRGEGGFGSTGQRNNNSNQQQAPQGDSYYL